MPYLVQAAHLLASLALAPLLHLLENRDGTPLSTVPGCHPQVHLRTTYVVVADSTSSRLLLLLEHEWTRCSQPQTSCCCPPPGSSSPPSTGSKSPSTPSRVSTKFTSSSSKLFRIHPMLTSRVSFHGLLTKLRPFCKFDRNLMNQNEHFETCFNRSLSVIYLYLFSV